MEMNNLTNASIEKYESKELQIDIEEILEPKMSNLTNASIEKYKSKQLQIGIEEILEPTKDCCIYRVPKDLRTINEKVYTPQSISIGPFHFGKKELVDMEKQKVRYKKKFGERIMEKWEDLITYIKNYEQNIRNYYAETFKLQSFEFITMILYDAIFIIELFLSNSEDKSDFLLNKSCIRSVIWLDLQLLENQLPYFILEELYKLAKLEGKGYPDFFSLSCKFFSDLMLDEIADHKDVKHFLDMRRCALLKTYPEAESSEDISGLPSAFNLHESGVKFKHKGGSLLDIKFEKNKRRIPCLNVVELQIPRITVDDNTECLFRNLMALEQCHYPSQTHICNYIDLMDVLINIEKDVELLAEKGIISNRVGENAAIAKMFNQLCLQINVSHSCYSDIVKDLKAHYDNPWNHTKATLKSVYFSNLWRGTGTIAAIVLLLLTLAQTILSILQVV